MQVHIYRRKGESPYWHAQAYLGGRRYRFSCLTDDKPTAREYARQRLEGLKARHNRGLIGLPDPVRISQVFARYEREELPKLRPASQLRASGIVAQLRAWFVNGPLHDPLVTNVRSDDVAAFLERKRSEGVSPRTVNLYRATLHRVFRRRQPHPIRERALRGCVTDDDRCARTVLERGTTKGGEGQQPTRAGSPPPRESKAD